MAQSSQSSAARKKRTAIDFFSGIGAMHFSAKRAGITVTAAFDGNVTANIVYAHNFEIRPHVIDMQQITEGDIREIDADCWLLSSPCHPSALVAQRQSGDLGTKGLSRLLGILYDMKKPPKYIFIEDVVGFEMLGIHDRLVATVSHRGYAFQEFILSPTQVGLPNQAPRYFFMAKSPDCGQFLCPQLGTRISRVVPLMSSEPQHVLAFSKIRPLRYFLEQDLQPKDSEAFPVPSEVIKKHGLYLDIVTPDSRRSRAFTKAYTHFAENSGSVIRMVQATFEDRACCVADPDSVHSEEDLLSWNLRYFTPREIAALHGFPPDFTFPEKISMRQKYRLLGQCGNVIVMEHLLKYLFS